jgi:hypothetical protein
MQWRFEGSDEAPEVAGAGIFAGRCRPFPSIDSLDALGIDAVVGMALYTGKIHTGKIRG